MSKKRFTLPFILPVAGFALTILIGSFLLWWDQSAAGEAISFIDALFTATSAVCVTGLATVDASTAFNRFGHTVIMLLIQVGGLGITTYTTLILYMWSKRVSLTDRLAVGKALLNDTSFHLGKFLQRVALIIFSLELCGAFVLYIAEPEKIGLFHALFLAVSAFCNAGFALWPDNLIGLQQNPLVNSVVMLLIILGGLGFAVIDEILRLGKRYLFFSPTDPKQWKRILNRARSGKMPPPQLRLSWHSRIVLRTTFWLVFGGALSIFILEFFSTGTPAEHATDLIWPSLFQSVTSRTAGFATTDIGRLSDSTLLVIILLMFIGGSPGSCAGGIKTTSLRVLLSFTRAQLKGQTQVVLGQTALANTTINKMFVLLTFSVLTIALATFTLACTEGGAHPHGQTPFQILDLFFEAVSAFATVGLSTGITPKLSSAGKLIDCMLMFIGRLGPIWLITTIQQFQTDPKYRLPETDLPIG